jgi:hypothetical protein
MLVKVSLSDTAGASLRRQAPLVELVAASLNIQYSHSSWDLQASLQCAAAALTFDT